MSARTKPPFRADHVGSLLRPPELLQARADHTAGALDDAGLRAAEDAAIRDVVKLQEDLGIGAVTDGEFRRASWHMDFIYQLGGVTRGHGRHARSSSATTQGVIEFTPAGADGRRQGRRRASRSSATTFGFLQSHRDHGACRS